MLKGAPALVEAPNANGAAELPLLLRKLVVSAGNVAMRERKLHKASQSVQ
jgi:hypothetical protein